MQTSFKYFSEFTHDNSACIHLDNIFTWQQGVLDYIIILEGIIQANNLEGYNHGRSIKYVLKDN
jgi:hypothetical protein